MLDLATVLFGLARLSWATVQMEQLKIDLAAQQREQVHREISELLTNLESGEFQMAERSLQDAFRSSKPLVELTAALTHFQSAEQLGDQAAWKEYSKRSELTKKALNHFESSLKAMAYQIRVYQIIGNPEMVLTNAGRFRRQFKDFYLRAHEWAGTTDSPTFEYYKECRKGANELLENFGLKKIKKVKDKEPTDYSSYSSDDDEFDNPLLRFELPGY